MPSFEQLILSSPSGFVQSCLALNKVAAENEEILSKLVIFAWKDVMSNGAPLDQELLGFENEKDGLVHIVRAMKGAQPTVGISAAAKVLLSSSLLIQASVEKILMQVKELSKASAGENNDKKVLIYYCSLLFLGKICKMNCRNQARLKTFNGDLALQQLLAHARASLIPLYR